MKERLGAVIVSLKCLGFCLTHGSFSILSMEGLTDKRHPLPLCRSGRRLRATPGVCMAEDRRSHQGERKEVQHLLDRVSWPPRPAPPSPPQGLQACEQPWYSSYAVVLGQEPSLKSTSEGVGRCEGRQKPSPCPGSADVRATPGSLLCHSQRVWSLLLPREHFQALRDHVYSYGPGERQSWPLDRNTSAQPGVYFKSWLVPGFASDRAAALSAAAIFIYSPRKTVWARIF